MDGNGLLSVSDLRFTMPGVPDDVLQDLIVKVGGQETGMT